MSRYIDAEKLKERLHIGDELMEKFNVNPAVAQLINIEKDIVMEMEKHIDETPTEDVAPIVRGKWFVTKRKGKISWVTTHSGIEEDVEYGVIVTCKCSNCGYKMGELALEYNYCPKCGSRMTEESGETQ